MSTGKVVWLRNFDSVRKVIAELGLKGELVGAGYRRLRFTDGREAWKCGHNAWIFGHPDDLRRLCDMAAVELVSDPAAAAVPLRLIPPASRS